MSKIEKLSLLTEYQMFVESKVMEGLTTEERKHLAVLGIGGEAGEIVDGFKKVAFHGKHVDVEYFIKECGDLLFYIVLLARQFNYSLEEVIEKNIEKLNDRYTNAFTVDESENRQK